MSKRIPFLSVPSKKGESIRQKLLQMRCLNTEYRVVSKHGRLFFPLKTSSMPLDCLSDLSSTDITTGLMEFPLARTGPRTLADALKEVLDDRELDLLPRAYDLIGDIAVLEIPPELSDHASSIGAAFLRLHPNFTTVLNKKGAIKGIIRTRDYELLAGENKTSTIHTEYGCRIAVDLAKAYFSPRLLEEHRRIAKQVLNAEYVVDMFTGVGPFPLHIAKLSKSHIDAVDVNAHAIQLLRTSMQLNRLKGTITPINSDVRRYAAEVNPHIADRVIMNHPSGAIEFIDTACHLLKPGGTLHYYDFAGGTDIESAVVSKLQHKIRASGRSLSQVLLVRKVRDSAPYEHQVVVDAIIE